MNAVINKEGVFFNKGYLIARDANGNDIVFGQLTEFGFKSNYGLNEFMGPDSLMAVSVGISEEKITVNAKHGKFKPDQLVLALGGTKTTVAAVADATTAPTLTAGTGPTEMLIGYVAVAYSWRSPYGSTKHSAISTVSITATQKITVSSLTLPTGATEIDLFVSTTSYASAPLAAAGPLHKLATIPGGAAYPIMGYALETADTPREVGNIGTARDVYTKGVKDEPLPCIIQFNTAEDGSGMEFVGRQVIFTDIDWTAALNNHVIPGLSGNVYGGFDILMPPE